MNNVRSGQRVLLACVVVFAAFSMVLYLLLLDDKTAEPLDKVRSDTKTLRFIYEVSNEANQAVEHSLFSTYLPVDVKGIQSTNSLKVSSEYEIEESLEGNRVLRSSLGVIPPYGVKKLSIVVSVESNLVRENTQSPVDETLLQADEFIEVDSPPIQGLANKLRAESHADSALKVYNWVASNLNDAGYTSYDKGALYALKNLKGDCTEFMYLTIALARAMGIPARGVGGYVYSQSTVAKSSDYHNWAELYFDGKWNVVDAQKKIFQKGGQDYITMRYLSDTKSSLLGSSHRFSLVGDDLNVRML